MRTTHAIFHHEEARELLNKYFKYIEKSELAFAIFSEQFLSKSNNP